MQRDVGRSRARDPDRIAYSRGVDAPPPAAARAAKQVIVMRKDLGMRKGKMIAQGAHASLKVVLDAGGLAPESFNGFIIQRMRWTQGMTQIMLLKLPGALGKLTWNQALSYVNSCIFWLFPPARLIFMLSPCLYLFFGLEIYNASFAQIAAFAFPHVIASQVCNTMLFGKSRWPLVSELYEVIQSCYALLALIQVFRNPRQPQFIVTPKGELLDEDFISPMVKPFYYLIAFWLFISTIGMFHSSARPTSCLVASLAAAPMAPCPMT